MYKSDLKQLLEKKLNAYVDIDSIWVDGMIVHYDYNVNGKAAQFG